jgi:hypothetical protein
MERLEQLRELVTASRRLRDDSRKKIAQVCQALHVARERNADARKALQAVWLRRELERRKRISGRRGTSPVKQNKAPVPSMGFKSSPRRAISRRQM